MSCNREPLPRSRFGHSIPAKRDAGRAAAADRDFAPKVDAAKASFLTLLARAKTAGETVAAAKGDMFLSYSGVTARDFLDAADACLTKQRRLGPGSHNLIVVFDDHAFEGHETQ